MRWRTKTTRKVNDFLSCCPAKKKENDLFFCFRPPPPKSYTRPEPVRGEYSSSYVSGKSHTGRIQSFSIPMCSEATSSCGDVLVPASFNCENLKKKTSKADAHSQGGHIAVLNMIFISFDMIIHHDYLHQHPDIIISITMICISIMISSFITTMMMMIAPGRRQAQGS